MNECLLREGNNYISNNDLEGLKNLYQSYASKKKEPNEKRSLEEMFEEETGSRIDQPFLFSKLFINACHHNRCEIAQWLYKLYQGFDEGTRLALRTTFNYTRHMTRRNKFYQLHNWLNKVTLPQSVKVC